MSKKIFVAQDSGFCEGVKRAIILAEQTIKKNYDKEKIYSLGRLVHNSFVVKKFENLGVKVVKNLDEIALPGYLIISAHGVSPSVIEKAKQKQLKIIDTTCPWVKKVQEIAQKSANSGSKVIIVGDRKHPEVKAVVDWAGNQAKIVEKKEDLKKVKISPKITLIAQTTQSVENFDKVVKELRKKNKNVTVYNTICGATSKRQKSAIILAKKVEVMLVIGDKVSANTKRLYQLCKKVNKNTFFIQSARDLKKNIIINKNKVGITAGASTPDWIIKEVIKKIKEGL